jgi:hypothetical protein
MFVMHWPGWLIRLIDLQPAARSGDPIPVGGEIFRTHPDPVSYSLRTGYLSRMQSCRYEALTTHPHLATRLKSRAVPLLPLGALMACCRVNLTLPLCISCVV